MLKVSCSTKDVEVYIDYKPGQGPIKVAFVPEGEDPIEDDWVEFSSRECRALIRTLDGARKVAYGTEALVRIGGDSRARVGDREVGA